MSFSARAIVTLVVIGACKKSPPPPVTSGAVTCEQVGGSLAASLQSEGETIQQAVIRAVIESCRVDAWSVAARQCFVAGPDAAERCKTEVTDEQARKLDDRIDSAIAKAAPASCDELAPAITERLTADLDKSPPDQRAVIEPKIGPFAAEMTAQCHAGWSAEARTCLRDASRDASDAGRCARWLDDDQRAKYHAAVEAAFGTPPPEPAP
jgi:hypothetical protein